MPTPAASDVERDLLGGKPGVGGAAKHRFKGLWVGPGATRLIRKLQRQAFDYWAGRAA